MRAFVTGGNGFIGSHLVEQLLARGDTVVCLARYPEAMESLRARGAEIVRGDITDRASLEGPMRGADALYHLAGLYQFGPKYTPQMQAINVDGARNVLETAAALGVPRIVHTSTVGVFGNTHGLVVDETYRAQQSDLASEYERTKWQAHYEVAVPLQQRGAPVVIVQPGGVTGAGDTSPHMQVMDLYISRFPLGFGARSGLTYAHVDDIAAGHVLAAERGKVGESYVLAGPSLTYRQTMELWAKLTGIPVARVWLPGWMVQLNRHALEVVERAGIHPAISAEGLASLEDYTFWASPDKAIRELGWRPRPVEETFREVLAYEMARRGMPIPAQLENLKT